MAQPSGDNNSAAARVTSTNVADCILRQIDIVEHFGEFFVSCTRIQ
jgi:hypothetical protein